MHLINHFYALYKHIWLGRGWFFTIAFVIFFYGNLKSKMFNFSIKIILTCLKKNSTFYDSSSARIYESALVQKFYSIFLRF